MVDERRSVRSGAAALVAGVVSALGSLMIYATSFWFDPPGWLRIPTMLLFPLGLIAAVPLGLMAFRGRGRVMGVAGWAFAAAGLALFVYAIVVLG